MATVTRYVSQGSYDYDDSSSTDTTITAQQNPAILIDQDAAFRLDTSVAGTITAATVHWYDHSFSKVGKTTTYQGQIDILGTEIYSFNSSTAPTTGWKSHALTSGEISLLANGLSTFNVTVDNPGGANSRSWSIRAYEYAGSYEAYIVLDYDLPVTERRQRIFIL